ncbi:MAG: VOC family protein [Bacteroidota bacterium]
MTKTTLQSLLALTSLLFLLFACSKPESAEKLGNVSAFAEMVAADVKRLALSPLFSSEELDRLYPQIQEIAAKYDVATFRENDLIKTDLFPEDVAEGKEVVVTFKPPTLQAYLQLKRDKEALVNDDEYKGEARREIARRFGRLLSYSPQKINQLLASNTDFRTMVDFGVKATNVFLYYQDLAAATKFYGQTLGLKQLATYDNATTFQLSKASYLILVDAAKGMHTAEEPKSVALALLTDELQAWYDYLQTQDVEIKYTLKLREGGPHDGFVALDPEGYLLEFEQFKQHSENEDFVPLLSRAPKLAAAEDSDVPEGLGFYGSITWLYYKELLPLQNFYEQVLGLKLVADQGWTKIYQGSDTGFIGLVDERRGMNDFTEDKAVNVSWILSDVQGWFDYAQSAQPFPLRSEELGIGPEGKYKAFVGFDPGMYYMEFDQFYEHPDNEFIMEALSQ